MSAIDIAEFDKMVDAGFHWFMVRGDRATTVQALTDDGYEALCAVLRASSVPEGVLERLGLKLDGRYFASLPLEQGGESLAKALMDSAVPGVCLDA